MVTRRTSAGAAVAVALLVGGCTATGSGPGPERGTAELRLVAFDSCAETVTALRRAVADDVGPYGFGARSSRESLADGGPVAGAPDARAAAPPAPTGDESAAKDHSTTNNHEAGVDEADLVKTDGRRIVTVADGVLRVVDVANRRLAGTLDLTDPTRTGLVATQVLLHGDRALVVATGGYPVPLPGDGPARPGLPNRGVPDRSVPDRPLPGPVEGSKLFLVDVGGEPRVLGSLTVDGSYLDARQVGAVARVVVRSGPRLPFRYPDAERDSADTGRANRAAVATSTADDWLPRYELATDGRRQRGRVGCDRVVRPAEFTGESMLTLYTLDLGKVLTSGDPLTVVADGDTVYASGEHLYVAHDAYFRGRDVAARQRTTLHQFDIAGAGRPRYAASGSVPGQLLNQYALSEHDGHLRVATTSTRGVVECCDQAPDTVSSVYVLAARGRALVEVGRVSGLGKGERIHAVRFAGGVGYVVTFRQTDPVYTLDLREPTRPKVTGELKIPGYSAYLHPVDEKTLIGVGQDATDQGRRLGTQVSVFDVGDPARPRQVATYRLAGGSSEVEFDPHAFLYWPKTRTIVVPVTVYDGRIAPGPDSPKQVPGSGAVVLALRDGTLTERGVVRHPVEGRTGSDPSIRRALVIDETLWTISAAGIRADGMATLEQQAWLPFR